jgi:hypothetical protein
MEDSKKIEEIRTSIEQQTQNLVQSVRDYSKAQVDYWKQVPSLALEADGRSGYNDDFARAYHYLTWPVLQENITWGSYKAFVSLETGEIINYPRWLAPIGGHDGEIDINNDETRKSEVADEDTVLRLANQLENLDAVALVDSLKKYAKTPYWRDYDPTKIIAWRKDLRKRLNLIKPEYEPKV